MVLAGMAHGACEDGCEQQDDDDRRLWAEALDQLDPES